MESENNVTTLESNEPVVISDVNQSQANILAINQSKDNIYGKQIEYEALNLTEAQIQKNKNTYSFFNKERNIKNKKEKDTINLLLKIFICSASLSTLLSMIYILKQERTASHKIPFLETFVSVFTTLTQLKKLLPF